MQIKHVTGRKTVNTAFRLKESKRKSYILKPHLHALKKIGTARQIFGTVLTILRHGTPTSTCKRIGPKCNMAPVLKILRVPRLPPGGSLGTGKRGTVPKIWRAVPIFLAQVNGVWIPRRWFPFPGTGIRIHFNIGCRIPWDFRNPWSAFRIPKPRIPDYTRKHYPDSGTGSPYMGNQHSWNISFVIMTNNKTSKPQNRKAINIAAGV